ncbi:hypothetical protein ATG70_1702 [Bacillus sp. es.036]|nr:hypothetical protein ATG70_1702 [Bacillus sp. es.036]
MIPVLFIANFFLDFITLNKLQGLPIFFPLLFCTIGLLFAAKALGYKKSVFSIAAIVGNGVLIMFPFFYLFLGTLIFGT